MSARGIGLLKRALRSVIADDRRDGARRKSLKGSSSERSAAHKQCQEWLNAIRLEMPTDNPLPPALSPTVAEIRKSAMDVRLKANVRKIACGRLLRVEGFSFAPRGYEPTDKLLDKFFGDTPEPEDKLWHKDPKYLQYNRKQNRCQALLDIRACLIADAPRLRGMSAEQVAEYLRLPEQESTAPEQQVNLAEVHKAELDRVRDLFSDRRNDV